MKRPGINLLSIARAQRRLMWGFMGLVVFFGGAMVLESAGVSVDGPWVGVPLLGLVIFTIVQITRLASATGRSGMHVVGVGGLMAVPLANLMVLLSESSRATRTLEHAGLRVGPMGVSSAQVRILARAACRECGFARLSLDGTRCPECGLEKPMAMETNGRSGA